MSRLLLIDDEKITTRAFASRLERRGFEVAVLDDGQHILEHLEQNSYDLILLDFIMPSMNGDEVLKLIRSKYDKNQLPVIMISAITDVFDISEMFKGGVNDFMTKPVNVDIAVARVKAHLSTVDLQRQDLKRKESEAISAMIVTYNHELNNPLAIALASLEMMGDSVDNAKKEHHVRLVSSLQRIAEIVKKIDEVSVNSSVKFEDYSLNKKMVKLG